MKSIRRFIFAFLLMMWGLNGSAFDYEGISYDVLSESNKTACVARQTATDQLVGDVVIPSKVKDGGTVYTVTEISGWAFSSCKKMTSIAIPATVQRIGYSAFWGCSGLKAVNVEDIAAWCSVKQEGGTEGNPLRLAHCLLLNGEKIKELVIPEGVTAIGKAYGSAKSLIKNVVIPASVTSIDDFAFSRCTQLTSVVSKSDTPPTIGSSTFTLISPTCVLWVPYGKTQAYRAAGWGDGQDGSASVFKEIKELPSKYDVNEDGTVSISDVTKLVNVILGKD